MIHEMREKGRMGAVVGVTCSVEGRLGPQEMKSERREGGLTSMRWREKGGLTSMR